MAEPSWTNDLLEKPHAVPDKALRVRGMFNSIAPRYEFVNRLFSFGRDAAWRRRAVKIAGTASNDRVLDVATGTGDFARAFRRAGARTVVGCDFAHEMLVRAADRNGVEMWCEADAQRLPFRDGGFSIVSCAFGVRNFQDLQAGLSEMARVLEVGGRAVILEFSDPPNRLFRSIHHVYAGRFMPWAASLISGDRTGAYHYLPRSIDTFPSGDGFCAVMGNAGFDRVEYHRMTMGIVTIYLGWREARS